MTTRSWILLVIAGVFEVVWATGLKYSRGFSLLVPSVVTIITMLASFYFLAQAMQTIPLGTAYAVWTGIGAVGTAVLGIILFGEPHHLARLLCILLVVVGIVGLKMTAAE